ncbi:hypothetical protein K469DRAFT_683039 [Zopfia rhizophila CBS 207.26]|uniref:HMG box domain-containing protein n=1 Tax=Zopfia rhizophila CBS 207.26 TaxID=1314779 RepID=A0A6A6ED13_9PEZI|nr:hypothetical protein K469DRAFT_683039 [Zopfia rhizophila CBS 207.26]
MKSETVVQQHPPTPPNVTVELQYGLHHIAQHNAERNYLYDESQLHGSAYVSPGHVVHEGIPQDSAQHFQDQHVERGHYAEPHGPDFGLEIQYDRYGQGAYYQQEGQYNEIPHNQGMFSGSPPTPRSATENYDTRRRTRSGHFIAPSSSPTANDKSWPKSAPKPKKPKAGKSDKPKTPKLTAPLSVLTKDMTSIPVRNMEEWVNRPPEVRRKEVEKRNGYITRPMNSFMLYRSAYAERTKQWCLQNNHQVVSSVSGESWPLEPPEVRDLYNEYAKIERINHQNAHPTYKFSPSKATTPSRKRKGEYSDDEEPSDLDDAEWGPGHHRFRAKSSRRPEKSAGYPSSSMNADFFDRSFGPNINGMNKSAWNMTQEGRPMPFVMGQGDMYNQYYPTTMHPNMAIAPGVMEDLQMQGVGTPGASVQFPQGHALLGLPGGNAADMTHQLHSHSGTPLDDEPQVDPMLLAFDGGHHHDAGLAMVEHAEFRNGHIGMMDGELDQDSVNSLLATGPLYDEYHSEPWQADPTIAPMEAGSEFDKWMDNHHS